MMDASFATRAAAEAASVAPELAVLRTAGFHSPDDGGGALYHRVRAEPSHAGRLRTADGAWWEIRGRAFSALQFGARGDGTTDDSEAINRALSCPLVLALHFPPGRYRAIGLTLRRHCAITGEAAELFWDEPGNPGHLLLISAPSANVRGLTFSGLRYETLNDPISPNRLLSVGPPTPQDGGEVRLQDLTFIGGCNGCVVGAVSNVFIDRLRFERCRNYALILTAGPRNVIINGLIASEIGEYGGIATVLASAHRATERLVINDFVVTDCARADADPRNWQEGLDLVCGFAREFVITNGVISNCGNGGIELKTGAVVTEEDDVYQDMLISNVVINVQGNRHAIVLNWTGRKVNSPKRGRRILIAGNIIRHEGATGTDGSAITISAWSDVHIANNYFEGCHAGIVLTPRGASDDTIRDISISGNQMRDVQVGLLAANRGEVERLEVSGNVINCGLLGIQLAGARCRGLLIAHNRIVQRGTSPRSMACIQLRNALDVEVWNNNLESESGFGVWVCDPERGPSAGAILRNVLRTGGVPFRIEGGQWEVFENVVRTDPKSQTIVRSGDTRVMAAWNVRQLTHRAPTNRGSIGDVALSQGYGVPPPGWWFDPGQQEDSGGWIAVASPAASHRTKPMFILEGPFERKGAFGWVAALPAELGLADPEQAPNRRPVLLFENGCCLSDGRHPHRTILGEGRGRYSFENGDLYFSTSDNSDPNTNGHVYEVRLRMVIDASWPGPESADLTPGGSIPRLSWQPPR